VTCGRFSAIGGWSPLDGPEAPEERDVQATNAADASCDVVDAKVIWRFYSV
jgi:hypothetical protein